MSKLLIILFLILSFNLNGQKVICHSVSFEDECVLINRVLEEFVCDTNVVVMYNGLVPLYPGLQGVTWQYEKKLYVINLNFLIPPSEDRRVTILHEMGHVIDLYEGILTISPLTWKGDTIDENIPYNERPWEKSAQKWANILWDCLIDEPKPKHR